jgi:hypothetical protein
MQHQVVLGTCLRCCVLCCAGLKGQLAAAEDVKDTAGGFARHKKMGPVSGAGFICRHCSSWQTQSPTTRATCSTFEQYSGQH